MLEGSVPAVGSEAAVLEGDSSRNTSRACELASPTSASRSAAAQVTLINELVYLGGIENETSAERALPETACVGVPYGSQEAPGGRRLAAQPLGDDLCAASTATVAKTGNLVWTERSAAVAGDVSARGAGENVAIGGGRVNGALCPVAANSCRLGGKWRTWKRWRSRRRWRRSQRARGEKRRGAARSGARGRRAAASRAAGRRRRHALVTLQARAPVRVRVGHWCSHW